MQTLRRHHSMSCHLSLSCAASIKSTWTPSILMSLPIVSFHLFLGLPAVRVPAGCRRATALTRDSSSLRAKCSAHLRLRAHQTLYVPLECEKVGELASKWMRTQNARSMRVAAIKFIINAYYYRENYILFADKHIIYHFCIILMIVELIILQKLNKL